MGRYIYCGAAFAQSQLTCYHENPGKEMNKIIAETFLVLGITCAALLVGLELLDMESFRLSFSAVTSAIGVFCLGSFLSYLMSKNK